MSNAKALLHPISLHNPHTFYFQFMSHQTHQPHYYHDLCINTTSHYLPHTNHVHLIPAIV